MTSVGSYATSCTNHFDHQDTFLRLAMGNRVLTRTKWHTLSGLTEENSMRLFTEVQ